MAYQPKSYRKFVATAATATLVASAVAPAASAATNSFTDVPERYQEAVDYLVANGITSGMSPTKFGISEDIKRADAAVMLAKALGIETLDAPASGFTDVPERAVKAVNALKAEGYINGKTATKFGSDDPLTRGEVALILTNAYKLDGEDAKVSFTDVSDRYLDAVKALVNNDITSGKTPTSFGTADKIIRGDFAVFLFKVENLEVKPVAPEVVSVSAINAKQAKVNFKGALPEGVDFSNFEINGGLVVTDAKVSADRKSATLTFNQDLTRDREYTITVSGIKNENGIDYQDTTGKFTWSVAQGVTVALDASVLEQGQVTGLTVKDESGKLVKDAKVSVRSYNENLVTVNVTTDPTLVQLTAQALAGTTDIEVVTTLPDGSVLTNTFKVTVKEAVTTVANKGYSLVDDATTLGYKYDNTVAFAKYASAVTSLVVDESKDLVAYTETNGNPDAEPISFEGATVKTSNGIVATAIIDADNNLVVTGNAAGTATLSVTLKDGSKKSFPITVTAKPVLKDVTLDATSIKLSDETTTADTKVEGINVQTVTVSAKDQFGDKIPFGTAGKVTVSSSTDALTLSKTALTFGAAGADKTDSFTVTAQKDKTVSNATVKVSYFAKATDATPTVVKTINVNVVNIDPTATAADLDVIAPAGEIDANALNTPSLVDVDTITFTASKAFQLDSKGNRIAPATISAASLATKDATNQNVVISASDAISFVGGAAQALTYSDASGTVSVEVTDGTITKVVPVKYKNSAVIPASATVATSPVSIKVPTGAAFSIEKILFGAVDEADATNAKQLILDSITSPATAAGVVGVSKNAVNGGYLYNKPLVTVTGTDGKVLPTGVSLYGTDLATEFASGAGLWNNLFVTEHQTTDFLADGFDVDFAITNEVKSAGATVTEATGVTLTSATDYATFTLVVKGIYIEGADKTKAENNLLAAPVQVNVNVAGK
jgi:hypothetical protein